MRLYPDSKVYVVCPANTQTGGPELLHQLCSTLIQFGVNAFMFYTHADAPFNPADPVHPFYKKYHLPYTFNAEDSPRNIIILPEVNGSLLYMPKLSQRVFWWLSVDNYIGNVANSISGRKGNALAGPLPKIFYFDKDDGDINHWVQSEYARQFVKLNGVPDYKIYMVEDYLNQAFLSRAAQVDLSRKQNIVAFNPRKGFEVTQQLITVAPDLAWCPIQNMTPEQVQELLAAAKVYIDFGNHPGKDRIPREAAISGCVVITGRRGSASNDVDINIPAEFKFDERTANPLQVIEKIREGFENFSAAHEKQAAYRARILNDKNRFAREVAEAFKIKKLPPPTAEIAFTQGVGEKSFLLAQTLFQSADLTPSFIVDDVLVSTKISDALILREQNRNYLRVGENLIEIITQEDAKFLYVEGRIKNFALVEPNDAALAELKNFYAPAVEDVLIFNRQ